MEDKEKQGDVHYVRPRVLIGVSPSASFPLPPRCLQLIRVVPTGQKSIPYGVRSGCLDSRLIMIISYYSFSVLTPGLVGLRAGPEPEPETAWSKSTRANPGLVMQPPARDKA
jgi:hypothetical protein